MIARARWIAAIPLLLALGCSCREAAPTAGAEPSRADARRARALAPQPRGNVVTVENGRVHLVVEGALHLAVLERLAARSGFELVVGGVEPRRIHMRLEDAPLDEAIAALVGEDRYNLEYGFDPAWNAHVLETLRVGALEPAPVIAKAGTPAEMAAPAEPLPAVRERAQPPLLERADAHRIEAHRTRIESLERQIGDARNDALVRRLYAEIGVEREALQTELRRQLNDPDAALRSAAVAEIDTQEGQALGRVISLAGSDPDPAVRAAAAERLGNDGTFEAVKSLVDALPDPEPQVVLAVIEALEYAGDESLIPHLAPLAQHPDSRIREAAREAIETLE